MSRRPFEFTEFVKRQAFFRQWNRCAADCGESLVDAWDNAHHVVPNQAADAANRDNAWVRSVDNCVILCDSCHESAHQSDYRRGPVPFASHYRYSHGRDEAAHVQWARALDARPWPNKRS